jgi:hypothetical protein
MFTKAQVKELLTDLFEEAGCVIAGIVAMHEVPDDVVWQLMRNLDAIRREMVRRLGESGDPEEPQEWRPNLQPHPAIEEFLLRLRGKR